MNKNPNSYQPKSFWNGQPTSSNHAVSEQLRQGGHIRFKREYDRPRSYDFEPIVQSDKVEFHRVTGKKHAPIALDNSTIKRFKITVKDKITGDDKQIIAKLDIRVVNVLCCGMAFTFSCKSGSKTVLDSRDGKRKSLDYVKSELTRMGMGEQFAILIG